MEAKTSVRNFSLMREGKFRVNFDCFTARPHFIIVPEEDSSIKTYQALCDDQKKQVIDLALQMITEYKLKESRAVLSQHSGSWYSSKHNYHAHLCVESEEYLRIVNENLGKLKFWPESLPFDKIKKYPEREDEKKKAVKKIEEIIDKKSTKVTVEAHDVTEGPYDVLFHLSEPRVGFAVNKERKPDDRNAWLNVQKDLMLFASGNDLTKVDVKDDDHGCHVCLVLDGQNHGKSTLISELNNLRRN